MEPSKKRVVYFNIRYLMTETRASYQRRFIIMRSSSWGKRGRFYSVLMRRCRKVVIQRLCCKDRILEAVIIITGSFTVVKTEMLWCLNIFLTFFFCFLSVGSDKQRQPREETKEVRSTNQRVEDKMWRAANWGGQCTEGSSQLFHWGQSFLLSVIQAVFIHYRKTLCNWLKNLSWHSWSIRSSAMTSPFLVSLVFPRLASRL